MSIIHHKVWKKQIRREKRWSGRTDWRSELWEGWWLFGWIKIFSRRITQ